MNACICAVGRAGQMDVYCEMRVQEPWAASYECCR